MLDSAGALPVGTILYDVMRRMEFKLDTLSDHFNLIGHTEHSLQGILAYQRRAEFEAGILPRSVGRGGRRKRSAPALLRSATVTNFTQYLSE